MSVFPCITSFIFLILAPNDKASAWCPKHIPNKGTFILNFSIILSIQIESFGWPGPGENIIPLNLIKEVGKKVTKFGGKEILFGATATGILYNGLSKNDNYNKDTIQTNADIIQTNNLIKVYAKGQVNLDEIDENLAKRRALEDALYFASMKAGAEVRGFSSIDEQTNLNENFYHWLWGFYW